MHLRRHLKIINADTGEVFAQIGASHFGDAPIQNMGEDACQKRREAVGGNWRWELEETFVYPHPEAPTCEVEKPGSINVAVNGDEPIREACYIEIDLEKKYQLLIGYGYDSDHDIPYVDLMQEEPVLDVQGSARILFPRLVGWEILNAYVARYTLMVIFTKRNPYA